MAGGHSKPNDNGDEPMTTALSTPFLFRQRLCTTTWTFLISGIRPTTSSYEQRPRSIISTVERFVSLSNQRSSRYDKRASSQWCNRPTRAHHWMRHDLYSAGNLINFSATATAPRDCAREGQRLRLPFSFLPSHVSSVLNLSLYYYPLSSAYGRSRKAIGLMQPRLAAPTSSLLILILFLCHLLP